MIFSKLGKAVHFSKIGITTFAIGKVNKLASQRYLIKELSQMPGIPAKMSQILMMRFDQAPSKQTTLESIPLEWVKQHIETQSPSLASQIEFIDEIAYTASLGQVHRAQLKNGSEIAIKIRYPGIENEIKEQLEMMLGVFNHAPSPEAFKINTLEYGNFLQDFFKEEINYLMEANSQIHFKNSYLNDQRFIIPEVYLNYCTPSLLVQSFEPSMPLSECNDFSNQDKVFYSKAFKDFFINGLLNYGLIHTDLHEKNWGFRKDSKQIVIYDFGATLKISSEIRTSLQKLSELKMGNPSEYLKEFISLGFSAEKLTPIESSLKELSEILFEPVRMGINWNPLN